MIVTNTEIVKKCEEQKEGTLVCVQCGSSRAYKAGLAYSGPRCCDACMVKREEFDDWFWKHAGGQNVAARRIYVFCNTGLMLDWEFWHE